MGFRLQALGFGLWALGFRLQALGFGLWALGFRLWALRSSFKGTSSSGALNPSPVSSYTETIKASESQQRH
ncbi:hypothetical protein F8C67_08805 [Phaeocystidibacter luteus]|uniref:Uncharacterized protein n=1 Tax=Phaeocystidibacter luteus TaxID=911197 RepID=A0A6N6RFW7_9FLAO|nr:hypothetical protein F8C67_08805 [Phaeocystidibacter luteus]